MNTSQEQSPTDCGIAQALFLSWGSPVPYRAVVNQWRWRSVLLFLLLVAMAQFPSAVRVPHEVGLLSERFVRELVGALPPMSVQGGTLVAPSVTEKQEIALLGVERALTIDPTATTPTFPASTQFSGFLNARELVLRTPDGTTHTIPLLAFGDVALDEAQFRLWASTMVSVASVVVPLVLGVLGSILLGVKLLLVAFGGWLVLPRNGERLSYRVCVKLALVAAAPATILEAFLGAMDVRAGVWPFLSLGLMVVYFFFGVRANVPPSDEEE